MDRERGNVESDSQEHRARNRKEKMSKEWEGEEEDENARAHEEDQKAKKDGGRNFRGHYPPNDFTPRAGSFLGATTRDHPPVCVISTFRLPMHTLLDRVPPGRSLHILFSAIILLLS